MLTKRMRRCCTPDTKIEKVITKIDIRQSSRPSMSSLVQSIVLECGLSCFNKNS